MDIRNFFEKGTTREKRKKGRDSSSGGSDENDNNDKTHVMPRSLHANIGQASHSPAEPVNISVADYSSAIAEAIDNFLISSNLPTEDCVGFRFDGCSTMAGKEGGVQAILRKKYPALYFYCSSHKLNLVVNDANAVPEIRNTVATVKDVITFFRESTTRRNYAKTYHDCVRRDGPKNINQSESFLNMEIMPPENLHISCIQPLQNQCLLLLYKQ
ncbi:unnamed protein product [Chilo suppressalis]|uniref:DUF4371 domain-containing protein n=1 Tax=Chilo suppressalis TaxID=168631 RepID=A0ABN8B9W8_CHISP|nr:unnamed protein product [Chilo suppressalis]